MSKKRSLGSDPLFGGRTSSQNAFDFIGRSAVATRKKSVRQDDDIVVDDDNDEKVDKKIVSYYIEKDLIKEVKLLADLTNQCYSRLVSKAIRRYVEHCEY